MDLLVVVRAGDRLASTLLLSAVGEVGGGRPVVVHTSAEAELAVRSRTFELVVIDPDVAAPDLGSGDGRRPAPHVVGWLTAPSSSRVAALLAAGTEDVLDPTMAQVELVARLQGAVRRTGPVSSRPAVLGGLQVDSRLRSARWRDTPLALSPREVEVLQVLVAAGGRPVPRDGMYRQVWRWAMPRGDRTVDVNVKRLRSKLAAAGVPVEIATQPGVGYRVHVHDDDPVATGP